jgi:integrase
MVRIPEAWQDACEKAGVPGCIAHDLRRTAVRTFERAGVSRSVAMQLTGHKTESVYRRYAIVNELDLTEGVEKLAGQIRGQSGVGAGFGGSAVLANMQNTMV